MSTLNHQLPCLGCDSLTCDACFHRAAEEAGYVKASSEPVEWQVRFASSNGSWMSWHPISRDAFDRYHADPPAGVQLRQLYDAPPGRTTAKAATDALRWCAAVLQMASKTGKSLHDCDFFCIGEEVLSLCHILDMADAALAAAPAAQAVPNLPLDDDVREILGRPSFMCVRLAQSLRVIGHDIEQKAEAEQAATLHWLLGHYFRHGAGYQEAAMAELENGLAQAEAAAPTGEDE